MDKTSNSVMGDPSVKGVMRRLLIDLNQLPADMEERVDLSDHPTDDVPPRSHFYIELCFPKEDMEALKQKHNVLRLSSVATIDLRHLGFDGGCQTLMLIRDKRVQFPGEFLYAKARSWFKKGSTKEYQPQDAGYLMLLAETARAERARMLEAKKDEGKGNEKINDDNTDDLAAKALLQDFIKHAKARARHARMKGKKVQQHVWSTSTHFGGKNNMFVPKMRSVNAIKRATLDSLV